MTIKQIAEIASVDKTTVQRWLKKTPDAIRIGLDAKCIEAQRSQVEAEFTLSETIAIIRSGGNDTLADLLADNARKEEWKAERLPKPRRTSSGDYVRELIRATEVGLLSRFQFAEALGVTPENLVILNQSKQEPKTTMLGLPVNPEAQALAASLMDGITNKDRRQVHAVANKAIANAASREAVDKLNGKLSFGGQP
jgi:hypothetical protein